MTTTARTLREAIPQAKEKANANQYPVLRGNGTPVFKHLSVAELDHLLLSGSFDKSFYEADSNSNVRLSKTLSPTGKVTSCGIMDCLLISLAVGEEVRGTWSEIVYVGRGNHGIDAVRDHMNAGHPPTKEYELHIE